MKVEVGDITTMKVDAIVNAANERMLGGGGVDGAIHRAAGKELLEACKGVPQVREGVRCPTGEARITGAFGRLESKYVIHTVGPVYKDGEHGEPALLHKCYINSLKLAEFEKAESIAFPAISTGVYGYPKPEAAKIAVDAVRQWCEKHDLPTQVIFCCFTENDAEIYRALLRT